DDRAHGHAQRDVLAGMAELVGTPAGFAITRLVTAGIAVVDQGVDVAVGDHEDMPAPSTIAAVGAAEGNEFFATEADATAAAIAGGHVYGGFIDEFHETDVLGKVGGARRRLSGSQNTK